MKLRIAALGVLLTCWPAWAIAQNPTALFQQALVKERAEGNITEAIRLYERVVADSTSKPTLVARASLRLAHCYETQGKRKEAIALYEKVKAVYADQTDVVETAQAQLARFAPKRFTISGRVTGRDADHNHVRLAGAGQPAVTVPIALDGSYIIPNVAPGRYEAVTGPMTDTPVSVSVVDKDVTHLNLWVDRTTNFTSFTRGNGPSSPQSFLVKGRVNFIDAPAIDNLSIAIRRGTGGTPVSVQKDGTFSTYLPAGDYKVDVALGPRGNNYQTTSMVSGTVDLYANGALLRVGPVAPPEIIITITMRVIAPSNLPR